LADSPYQDPSLRLFKFLKKRGADITLKQLNGWSPLHIAAANGNMSLARWLLRNGLSVVDRDSDGNTPLDLAGMHCDNPNMVRLLIKQGASPGSRNIDIKIVWRAFYSAVSSNTNLSVIKLVNTYVSKHRDDHLPIPKLIDELLLEAAQKNPNEAIINYLFTLGANREARAYASGASPLHNACYANNACVIETILRRQPNIEVKDNFGQTPLALAVQRNTEGDEIIHLLLKYGANPNAALPSGETPYTLALKKYTEGSTVLRAFAQAGGKVPELHPGAQNAEGYMQSKQNILERIRELATSSTSGLTGDEPSEKGDNAPS
jgi:ankyrin repeat protein